MDRGKCKDPRATLILCAFAPVSGSAPVLVSAFGASADTSRRQEMQVGDLVWVEWREERDAHVVGAAIIVAAATPLFLILFNGEQHLMHADYLEAISASR